MGGASDHGQPGGSPNHSSTDCAASRLSRASASAGTVPMHATENADGLDAQGFAQCESRAEAKLHGPMLLPTSTPDKPTRSQPTWPKPNPLRARAGMTNDLRPTAHARSRLSLIAPWRVGGPAERSRFGRS